MHRLPVERGELYPGFRVGEGADETIDAVVPGVGNGYALAYPGGAELLALP